MIKAVDELRTSVKFYEVDYDLSLSSSEWLDSVQPNDLVVLIDYFGFPSDPYWIKLAKERGARVLEDGCQALLSEEAGRFSDFVLFSPRKFVGVPDGGILVYNHEIACDAIKIETPPSAWWLKAFSASVLRRDFDLHGGNRRWFELFQETEDEGPIGPYAMSEFSRVLLQHGFDYSMIAEKRVENYELLANELREFALFPSLPSGVVPLGFPIRVKDRDRVRQVLFSHEIYPPVHWPIQGVVPEEFSDSHKLASEIMTLPCDQRYGEDDMMRMIAVVLKEMIS
jgi:dTDP-4-amino-4,6-dideoxygalactose transaminase